MQRWQAAERSAILAGAMGLTVLELEIANPARPAVTERVDLLIDSGAIYSVVPAAILARLGIEPLVEQQFRLANGAKITRKKGARSSSAATESAWPTSSLARRRTARSPARPP